MESSLTPSFYGVCGRIARERLGRGSRLLGLLDLPLRMPRLSCGADAASRRLPGHMLTHPRHRDPSFLPPQPMSRSRMRQSQYTTVVRYHVEKKNCRQGSILTKLHRFFRSVIPNQCKGILLSDLAPNRGASSYFRQK